MNKKLMIIGAGDFQAPIIEYAAARCRVVIVAPQIPETLRDLSVASYLKDVRDKEEILSIARREGIDGVITDQTDIPVRTVAYVAEKMQLPGIGYDTGLLFTDKYRMDRRLEELGVKTIPTASTATAEEAVDFYRSIESDVILKPVDSQGSRGISVCRNADEVRDSFNKAREFSSGETVLVQKYITGREFFAESMVLHGKVRPLITGDTIYFDSFNAFAAKERVVPSDAPEEVIRKVEAVNHRIIEGFGLKQGITHSEFIMEGDDVYLIETAARGGGVFISSDLINIHTGICTEEFLTDIALGETDEMPEVKSTGKACGYMAFFLPDGEVTEADGLEEVAALPFVHRNQLDKVEKGMIITGGHKDKTSRFAVIVSASDRRELKERMDLIRGMLKIKVSDGEREKGPIWD